MRAPRSSDHGPDVVRVHGFAPRSAANGPGLRAVLWVQGCTLGCAGCFNPDSHPRTGDSVRVDDLVARIAEVDGIEGVTVSGGEPLQQRPAMMRLLEGLRGRTSLSVLMFTGFTWAEVQRMPEADRLLRCVDVLVAGRYDRTRPFGRGLRGSANQTVHLLSGRYTLPDVDAVPPAEVLVLPNGTVVVTGVDPPGVDVPGRAR